MPRHDPEIWVKARERLPLPALMAKIGDGAFAKASTNCPFCERRNKFGIFQNQNGRHNFKCHHTGCVANNPEYGRNEIGYLALRKSLPLKEAAVEYLRLADLFDERPQSRPIVSVDFARGDTQPPPPQPEDPRDGEPTNPWMALWQRLVLNAGDREAIRLKRGLSDETITRAGIRSNNETNLYHLEALAEHYPTALLVAEGIYKSDSRSVRPQGQLYGYGLTDKLGPDGKRAKSPDGRPIFEITNPPLIPYFDLQGIPYYMRPHKGGVTRPKDELEDIELHEHEDEGRRCASHPFCPVRLAELVELNDGVVIFTEGEWKALACDECDLAAIACPGITFIRNPVFRKELVAVLREVGATDMIVIFDNEDKADPSIPHRFIADPWRREETQVYAEIVAIELREYFEEVDGSCRIGLLPSELREDGKADFDGILAKFKRELGPEEGARKARHVFIETMDRAREKPTLDLFPTERRRIIEWRREQLFHKPLIAIGGDAEAKLAQRFARVDPRTRQPVDEKLAALYRGLRGCYYERAKPSRVESEVFERIDMEIGELEKSDSPDAYKKLEIAYAARAALWEQRKGIPKTISDFFLVCEYKLITVESVVHRLVTVRNRMHKGKSNKILHRLTPEDLSRCSNFREWCYGMGEAVWKGGEIRLQELVEDMDHHSFQRRIFEIDLYGYHPESKMWFFGDCTFTETGQCIHADEQGIYWHEGVGYQIDDPHLERGDRFSQGVPLMLRPQKNVPPLETPNLAEVFEQLSQDLYDTIGGYDGWLLLGIVFAYGVAPELVQKGGHPGGFVYGPLSGGKTSIIRWVCRIWGFGILAGIQINRQTTHVGMTRALTQYSCLPCWFDEYRRGEIDEEKEAVIRSSFDRGQGQKGVASPNKRTLSVKPMTTPIISGENSSGDSATRSRYGHVMVSRNRRIGDGDARFARVQEECNHYYLFGKFIMEHRPEYVAKTLAELDAWMADEAIRKEIKTERVRLVHGVAYAAFSVLSNMLIPGSSANMGAFKNFLIEHGRNALVDVVEEGFLNTFWREVVAAMQRDPSFKNYFLVEYRRLLPEDGSLRKCNANDSDAIRVCYVSSSALYGAYEKDLRSRGKEPPHGESDLRRELEKEPYWIKAPKDRERVHRKTIRGIKTSCWAISMARSVKKPDGEDDDKSPYLFPFAEELITSTLAKEQETPGPD